jgi:hypothetical protein
LHGSLATLRRIKSELIEEKFWCDVMRLEERTQGKTFTFEQTLREECRISARAQGCLASAAERENAWRVSNAQPDRPFAAIELRDKLSPGGGAG